MEAAAAAAEMEVEVEMVVEEVKVAAERVEEGLRHEEEEEEVVVWFRFG